MDIDHDFDYSNSLCDISFYAMVFMVTWWIYYNDCWWFICYYLLIDINVGEGEGEAKGEGVNGMYRDKINILVWNFVLNVYIKNDK